MLRDECIIFSDMPASAVSNRNGNNQLTTST